uniref:Uncharacterized protein n=1 Tax=Leersia perrieri TaxID=77586 RepID=A0A0D9XSG3_9ORYZ
MDQGNKISEQGSKIDLLVKMMEEAEKRRVDSENKTRAEIKVSMEARIPEVEKKVEDLQASVDEIRAQVDQLKKIGTSSPSPDQQSAIR